MPLVHDCCTMILALLLAATLLPTATAEAVEVRSCVATPVTFLTEDGTGSRELVDAITVSFVNHSSSALNAVKFRVRYNGKIETVVDRGPFAAGATVQQRLSAFELQGFAGYDASCKASGSI